MTTDTCKISTRARIDSAVRELDDIRAGEVDYATTMFITGDKVFYLRKEPDNRQPCASCAFEFGTEECCTAPACPDGYFVELG